MYLNIRLIKLIKLIKLFNACTQASFHFFTAKYEVLPKRPFVFIYSKIRNLKMFPKWSFALGLQNMKFLKLLWNFNSVIDNKFKNLKLHPNCYSVFERRNTKFEVVPKRPFAFEYHQRKYNLNYLLLQWNFSNSKKSVKTITKFVSKHLWQ